MAVHKKRIQKTTGQKRSVDRRGFLKGGVVAGIGGAAATIALPSRAEAQAIRWTREVDVVVIGAGPGGMAAAIEVRKRGASVLIIEQNFDIGGRAMMSGGNLYIGGGNRLEDGKRSWSPDALFGDWTRVDKPLGRFADRELARAWANASLDLFNFFEECGVKFGAYPAPGTVPDRLYREGRTRLAAQPWPGEKVTNAGGSGIVRPLEATCRRLGVQFLMQHRMTEIHREKPFAGPVLGVTAVEVDNYFQPKTQQVKVRARKGVVVATGGCASNVAFRTMFDPRLTAEYQAENGEWTPRNADGEIAAMAIGAALGATANQTTEDDHLLGKGGRLGKKNNGSYTALFETSPHFFRAGALGLEVRDWQDVILVKEHGLRFYDETAVPRHPPVAQDYAYFAAALDWTGDPRKMNGGGPIWAIFDSAAVARERWTVAPPFVDPKYFFQGDTLAELAGKLTTNEYQWRPMPGDALVKTVERYNSFVESGNDADFRKPRPMHKIATPPYYAAWATPVIHDTFTGIRINKDAQVIDLRGAVIPRLYACGDSAGGFGIHGITRAATFGRFAGIHAVTQK